MVPTFYSLLLRHYAKLGVKYVNILEGIRSSELWHRVSGVAVFCPSNDHHAFIFRSQRIQQDASEAPVGSLTSCKCFELYKTTKFNKTSSWRPRQEVQMNNVSKTDCASIVRVNMRTVTTEMKPVPVILACLYLPTWLSRREYFW